MEQASGIPKTMLSRYENGHVSPSMDTLWRLADALGVTEASLLTGDVGHAEALYRALLRRGVEIGSVEDAEAVAAIVAQSMAGEAARRIPG